MSAAPSFTDDQRALLAWSRSRHRAAAPPARLCAPGTNSAGLAARLRTVRQMLWLRQAEALATTYPQVRLALGQDRFRRVAASFIEACPTGCADLEDAGAPFGEFLARQDDGALRILAGLARVEWCVALSFRAPDGSGPAAGSPTELNLSLAPATRAVALDAHEVPCVQRAFTGVAGTSVLTFRRRMRVTVRSPTPAESAVLALAARDASFVEVCAACADDPHALARRLRSLLDDEIVILRRM